MRRLSLKVAGNFFRSLSNEIGERSSYWEEGGRKKNDFNFFEARRPNYTQVVYSNGTRHGERSFEESD